MISKLIPLCLLVLATTSSYGQLDLRGTTGVNPILGENDGDFSTLGTNYTHNGNLGYIADGNLFTAEDTYGHDTSDNNSFVGFTFATAPVAVTELTVNFKLDGDGGWFGMSGMRPPNNSTSLAGYLVEPTLQITTDGTDWTTVADLSTYMAILGADTEDHDTTTGNSTTQTVDFTLATPALGVEGIRLVGPNGGVAGDFDGVAAHGGFIAISEEDVYGVVPEPATYALIGLGAFAFAGWSRARKSSFIS